VDALRALVNDGDFEAGFALADLLAERDVEALRTLADDGHWGAQFRLADLLGERAAVKELKDLVHATFSGAADALISLYQAGRPDNSHLQLDVNAEPRPIT
jgi:hypothetical protein